MAAPLPTGAQVFALPAAPAADPRMFASDPMGALATAQAGLMLGSELANLENKRAERELEKARIGYLKSKNDFDIRALEHAVTNLPTIVGAQVAKARAEQAQMENARALALAQASVGLPAVQAGTERSTTALTGATADAAMRAGLPSLQADLTARQSTNALAGATADQVFASKTTPVKTQLLAASQALGSMGISEGGLDSAPGGVPPAFRKQIEVESIDPQTGNTLQRIQIIDSRDGRVLSEGPARTTKLGVDEKSVASAVKDATSFVQAIDLAASVRSALDAYIKKDAGGLTQAAATVEANRPAKSAVSVIARAAAAKAQTSDTVEMAAKLANLTNTIGNTIYGQQLSQGEQALLNAMLPTAADLADPTRAREKLSSVEEFLKTKLKPYADRGILEKAGLKPATPAAPAAVALPPTFGDAPVGTVQDVGGARYEMTVRNGQKGWARIK